MHTKLSISSIPMMHIIPSAARQRALRSVHQKHAFRDNRICSVWKEQNSKCYGLKVYRVVKNMFPHCSLKSEQIIFITFYSTLSSKLGPFCREYERAYLVIMLGPFCREYERAYLVIMLGPFCRLHDVFYCELRRQNLEVGWQSGGEEITIAVTKLDCIR